MSNWRVSVLSGGPAISLELIQREADADERGEGHAAADGEALDVGAAAAEVGVGEAVDDGVALDVAVTEGGLPVAEFLERGHADLEGEVPGGVAAFESPTSVGAAVVDGDLAVVDVEGEVLGDFADEGEA